MEDRDKAPVSEPAGEKGENDKEKPKKRDSAVKKMIGRFFGTIQKDAKAKIVCVIAAVILVVLLIIGFRGYTMTESKTTQLGFKNMGELSTQSAFYTNVQVLEESKKVWKITLPFTSSRYIFSYDGVIKAGYDFTQIEVKADDLAKKLIVKLPPVKILSNEIDTDSLFVYDESQSIFSPLTISDMNSSLNTLQDEAEEKAIGNGLFVEAEKNAKVMIESFLKGANPDYEIVFE